MPSLIWPGMRSMKTRTNPPEYVSTSALQQVPAEEQLGGVATLSADLLHAIATRSNATTAAALASTATAFKEQLQPQLRALQESAADLFTEQAVVKRDVTSPNSRKSCSNFYCGTFEVITSDVVLSRGLSEKVTIRPFADSGGSLMGGLAGVVKNHPQVMSRPHFPMYLMRGSQLKRLTRLPAFEEALSGGLLLQLGAIVYQPLVWNSEEHTDCDRGRHKDFDESKTTRATVPHISVDGITDGRKVLDPTKKRIFLSHHWLAAASASPHPDAIDNRKLAAIQAYMADDDYVWIDYCCCPQASDAAAERAKAIDSLLFYVGSSTELLCLSNLSPPSGGREPTASKEAPDAASAYLARGWAQLELLGAFAPIRLLENSGYSGASYRATTSRYDQSRYASNCVAKTLAIDCNGTASTRRMATDVLRDPLACKFSFDEDKERITPLLHTLHAMFAEAGWPFPSSP